MTNSLINEIFSNFHQWISHRQKALPHIYSQIRSINSLIHRYEFWVCCEWRTITCKSFFQCARAIRIERRDPTPMRVHFVSPTTFPFNVVVRIQRSRVLDNDTVSPKRNLAGWIRARVAFSSEPFPAFLQLRKITETHSIYLRVVWVCWIK